MGCYNPLTAKGTINTMNIYIAFYRGKQCEVHAETSLQAQRMAAAYFKAKKAHEVSVMLTEKDGEPVIHTPNF